MSRMATTTLALLVLAPLQFQQQVQPHPGAGELEPGPRYLEVLAVTPAPNALGVPRGADIEITFSEAVDPATLGSGGLEVWGRWSALTPAALSLSAGGRKLTIDPERPFSPAEWVTVSLSRRVRGVSGTRLERGASFGFWVDSRASSGSFTETTLLTPGQTPYGAYGGDIDEDGDLDLCIPNENTLDVSVFLNDGAGNMTGPVNYPVGFHCSPSEAADLDHDGRLDLVVSNILDNDVSVLRGNGNGTFQPQTRYPVAGQPRGLALVDFDTDGWMDAVTACRVGNGLNLLRNLGGGGFAPAVTKEAMVAAETGVAACDMNSDLVLDLVVVGYSSGTAAVLLGDGRGGFQFHSSVAVGSTPWMVVFGDVDADGFNDAAIALAGGGAVAIALNDGQGGLLPPTSYPTGGTTIAVDLGDLDGDGDLDFTGSSIQGAKWRAYHNDGAGNFTAAFTLQASQAGSCTVMHDIDGDGDIDITAIDEFADEVKLFLQDG